MLLHTKKVLGRKASLVTLFFIAAFGSLQAEVEYIIPLKASEHQIGNMLQWATSVEMNSHNFVIEKSFDGIHFDNIGLLDAAGISEEKRNYRFLDIGLNEDRAFYRLKQIDLDGAFDYSQTVLVNRSLPNQFMVVAMSRTSFDKSFQVTLDILNDSEVTIVVSDWDGSIIQQKREKLSYGLNDINFDLSNEKDGIYKIAILLKEEEELLVVQKTNKGEQQHDDVASRKKQSGG